MGQVVWAELRRFLATVPTTNFRIVVHVGLSVCYVLGTMIAGLFAESRLPPYEYHVAMGVYLLTAMGLDTLQFRTKRRTWNPLTTQDDEDSQPEAPES